MTPAKYDAIICDLGNVLINFDHRIAVRKIMYYTSKKEKDIYGLFFDSPLTGLYEEGKISSGEFFQKVKESLELGMEHDRFLPIWNEIFFETPLNMKVHNFLRSIKTKYKLIMVSNINETHFDFLSQSMDIFNEFDTLILSYEAGFRKPAPEVYHAAIECAKTIPSRILYIDDRKDLIEAAGELGIKGVVFDGEKAFEKIKKELGVFVE